MIAGVKLCASNLIESTTMGAGKNQKRLRRKRNNLSVQGQPDFVIIVEVES